MQWQVSLSVRRAVSSPDLTGWFSRGNVTGVSAVRAAKWCAMGGVWSSEKNKSSAVSANASADGCGDEYPPSYYLRNPNKDWSVATKDDREAMNIQVERTESNVTTEGLK